MESELIPCCEHCGCPEDNRDGHDDTCRYGCNDDVYELRVYQFEKPVGIITTGTIGAGGLKKPTKKGFK